MISKPLINLSTITPVLKEANTDYFFKEEDPEELIHVSYLGSDFHCRKSHVSGYLKMPVVVPNFLALCGSDRQNPWSSDTRVEDCINIEYAILVLCDKDTMEPKNVRVPLYSNSMVNIEGFEAKVNLSVEFNPQTYRLNINFKGYEASEDNQLHLMTVLGVHVTGIAKTPYPV